MRTDEKTPHIPVLLDETLNVFKDIPSGTFVDATLGMGGHSSAILSEHADLNLLGMDQDTAAIAIATENLAAFDGRVRIVHSNFSEIANVTRENDVEKVSGVLADLGVSSLQLDTEGRGFSFRFNDPLDMRMNTASDGETAADILAHRSEEEIADIIYRYGEERASRRIARRIVERRERGEPVKTTGELARLVAGAFPGKGRDKTHPATRTFQALRIAVNNELDILDRFLIEAFDLLKPEGVLAVITFHSLEDRIVKQRFRKLTGKCECPPRMPVCMCGAEKRG
ncbi:MAG: 16S rRNA (cytosine(1402)-N(4))-methyltransferase RsmH, partial [Acidobacteria bacterium]|nr:16S rRNA (cytosine(1402)-N(4))-methyltransferase RsmH [Acidobacteriota bacterium]